MKNILIGAGLLLLSSIAYSQQTVIPFAGDGFDGGVIFISSCAVAVTGSSWTFSHSAYGLDTTTYGNSKNTQWLIDNSEAEYDIMIDSCVWVDKGAMWLLGGNCPYLLKKGQWISLDAQCGAKVHMRLMSQLRGWTTAYYLKTYRK